MKVNPDELRGLVTSMTAAADAVELLDVRTAASAAGAALPGANLGEICASSGDVTAAAYQRAANRCRRVSQIAAGVGANFEVTDTDFSARLAALDGGR
ncbi:hypothetical protein ACFQZZ_33320 [Nocardia sp. GCM10030253]|uniref:hypothetical protein n=1 Tax=Nocardia sp. GCM10030253 TaxID=3273404 RepID=UPI00363BE6F7